MLDYQKIPSLYLRTPNGKTVLFGQFADPDVEMLKDIKWVFTEKIDGTNIRIHWDGHKVEIAGRTAASEIPLPLKAMLERKFLNGNMEEVFEQLFGEKEVYIFGEGYGPGIQKGGGNYRKDVGFICFDAIVGGFYLLRDSLTGLCSSLDLDLVPDYGVGTIAEAEVMVKEGLKSHFGNFTAEGIVARPVRDLFNRCGKRIVVKIKDCDINQKQ